MAVPPLGLFSFGAELWNRGLFFQYAYFPSKYICCYGLAPTAVSRPGGWWAPSAAQFRARGQVLKGPTPPTFAIIGLMKKKSLRRKSNDFGVEHLLGAGLVFGLLYLVGKSKDCGPACQYILQPLEHKTGEVIAEDVTAMLWA
jgi:hypothetical protein